MFDVRLGLLNVVSHTHTARTYVRANVFSLISQDILFGTLQPVIETEILIRCDKRQQK